MLSVSLPLPLVGLVAKGVRRMVLLLVLVAFCTAVLALAVWRIASRLGEFGSQLDEFGGQLTQLGARVNALGIVRDWIDEAHGDRPREHLRRLKVLAPVAAAAALSAVVLGDRDLIVRQADVPGAFTPEVSAPVSATPPRATTIAARPPVPGTAFRPGEDAAVPVVAPPSSDRVAALTPPTSQVPAQTQTETVTSPATTTTTSAPLAPLATQPAESPTEPACPVDLDLTLLEAPICLDPGRGLPGRPSGPVALLGLAA